jgi:hypothetical protein
MISGSKQPFELTFSIKFIIILGFPLNFDLKMHLTISHLVTSGFQDNYYLISSSVSNLDSSVLFGCRFPVC